MSKLSLGLGVALVASLAINAVLLLSREPAGVTPPAPTTPPTTAEPAPAAPAGLAQCEQALHECRAPPPSTWLTVARELPTGPVDAGATAIDTRVATPELQQDLISQIAREHLRREWDRKKDDVVRGVLKDLRDPQKQQRDFDQQVEQYARVIGLADAAKLGDRYRPIRTRRLQAVEQALGRQPPDFATVFAELKGLYVDEDALISSLAGKDPAARFKLSQLDSRTVILGIAATYAQIPWDQSIYP